MVADWALLYKVLFLVTVCFHPDDKVRGFSWWLVVLWYISGTIRDVFYSAAPDWYMIGAYNELAVLILAGLYFEETLTSKIIMLQGVCLFYLNLWQYCAWFEPTWWFMECESYKTLNKYSFELILTLIWFRYDVIESIKNSVRLESLVGFFLLCYALSMAGNY